ncbi:MAG: hypothetical protein MGG11_23280 [Trichodesmium sp. MAG_R03]|nr:hypothetical protein [Trichodesmium sp. MAG_R03]
MKKILIGSLIMAMGMTHPTFLKKFVIKKDCRTTITLKNKTQEFTLFDNLLATQKTVIFYKQDQLDKIDSLRVEENILIPFPDSLLGQYEFEVNSCFGIENEKVFFID